ncbi:hypothetical protein G7Y89_g4887 [Cudoniella acicularis]|uniref:Rhodopsin domain-containing protein n=1 Tax=Cudoniella acicularis TaxID=354080 RepID=A0A8H4RQR7_9HELO|nr:hypothetical protein G7Y89_g4887 [Cudoniella acicularis]
MASKISTETGVSEPVFLGVSITFIIVTGLFVAMRTWANVRTTNRLLVDDYIAALAVVLLGVTFGVDYKAVKDLTNPYTPIITLNKLAVAIDFLSGAAMIASKAPLLLLYVRIFGIKIWLKICSYMTLAALTVLMLASMIAIGIVCAPPSDGHVTTLFLLRCTLWSEHNGFACGILSLVVDIIILLLPIPIIIKLQLPMHKKIGLFLVFASGLLAIVASSISLHFKYLGLHGKTSDTTTSIFCTNIEWCVAVMVGCVPATSAFWSNIIVNSALYSRLTSVFSAVSFMGSRSTRRTTRSGSSRGAPAQSGESAERITTYKRHWDSDSPLKKSLSQSERGHVTVIPLRDVERRRQ